MSRPLHVQKGVLLFCKVYFSLCEYQFMFNWCLLVALCSKEEIALRPLQNSILCPTSSAVSGDLLVVVICVTRVSVELIFTDLLAMLVDLLY